MMMNTYFKTNPVDLHAFVKYFEFLSLKGGSTCSSGSTLVKMPHCWKSQGMSSKASNLVQDSNFSISLYFQYFGIHLSL